METWQGNMQQTLVNTQKIDKGSSNIWFDVSAIMIIFMQLGFALVEAGQVRRKNSSSIFVKNVYNVIVGVLVYWLIGFGLSYGDVRIFIGNNGDFFATNKLDQLDQNFYPLWIFSFAKAITCAIVAHGAFSERTKLVSYILFTFYIVAFIHPILVAWIWSSGWLYEKGFKDYSGSGVVFLIGGVSAFWGSWICGQRLGWADSKKQQANAQIQLELSSLRNNINSGKSIQERQEFTEYIQLKEMLQSQNDEFRPHNQGYIVFGTLLLIVGWLFFNGGRHPNTISERINDPARVIVNTLLSGSFGGLTAVLTKITLNFTKATQYGPYDAKTLCNGVLAGLVASSGDAGNCECWAACIIGIGAGFIYYLGVLLMERLQIDDTCDAVPIYLLNGAWGILAMGFLDQSQGVVYPSHIETGRALYFGYQCCGIAVIFLFTTLMVLPYFLVMNYIGCLRVERVVELMGLDYAEGLKGEKLKQKDFEKILEQLQWKTITQEAVIKEEQKYLLKRIQNQVDEEEE